MILFPIAVFCLGLIIGSFLNVVILRYGSGLSIAKGRSQCFSCGKTLSWYELLPVVSFVVQRGRCRGCDSSISWQYALVEFSTGLLFLFSYLRADISSALGILSLFLVWIIFALLVVITAYDFRHQIIPDLFSYAFAIISLGLGFISSGVFAVPGISYFLAGPALALFFVILWLITRGRGIGLGDAKLALGIGWFLGLSSGIASLFLAFWSGALISISIMAAQKLVRSQKALGMKSAVPFGPFLILGLVACFFLSIDMATLSSWLAF